MVGIKFCECLLFVTVEEPQYFISISMSHAWRPPSHAFFFFLVCLAVAYHEVGSSTIRGGGGGGGGPRLNVIMTLIFSLEASLSAVSLLQCGDVRG